MFISKGCLEAILENLSVLNKEVDELKKNAYSGGLPEQAKGAATNCSKKYLGSHQSCCHTQDL